MEKSNIVNFRNYTKTKGKVSLKRNKKKLAVSNKEIAVDDLFQKLEVKRNASGKIIDTRFPPEVQEYIRSYLKNKNIKYNDTGYLSLRGAYQSLSPEMKLELCININAKFDYGLNVEKEMKNAKGFFSAFKTASALTVGGAALGTMTGGALHLIKPDLIPNMVGQAGKNAVAKKLDDQEFRQDIVNRVTGAINDYLDTNKANLVAQAKTASGEIIKDQIPNLATSVESSVKKAVGQVIQDNAGIIDTAAGIGIGLANPIAGIAYAVSGDSASSAIQGALDNAIHDTLNDQTLRQSVSDMAVNAANNYFDTNQDQLVESLKSTASTAINDNMSEVVESAKTAANDYIDSAVKNNALPINLVTAGLTGLAIGAATAGVKSLIDIVKNINQRSKRKKLSRQILELDNVKYSEDNAIEAEKIRRSLVREGVIEESNERRFAA